MDGKFPDDYMPEPRRCERCGVDVLSARWYGGQGGEVVLDAEPTQVVRFVGESLTAWVYDASNGSAAAKRNAASMVAFDDAYTIHICPAVAATDQATSPGLASE